MVSWKVKIAEFLLVIALVLFPSLSFALDSAERMESLPIAKQVGPFEQAIGVASIPIDIVKAVFYAGGESYIRGNAYKGDYARHGFYRTHARWWDPFFYHHE